jgi:hypothetical protein
VDFLSCTSQAKQSQRQIKGQKEVENREMAETERDESKKTVMKIAAREK